MPHANSRFSRPRAISPSASEGTLPCSAVRSAGELVAVRLDQVPDAEHDVGPLRERRRAPAPGRRPWPPRPPRRPPRRRRSRRASSGGRWPGRRPDPRDRTCPATLRPPIQWLTRPGAAASVSDRARLCDLRHGEDLSCGSPATATRLLSDRATILRRGQRPRRRPALRPRALLAPAGRAGSGHDGESRRPASSTSPASAVPARHERRRSATDATRSRRRARSASPALSCPDDRRVAPGERDHGADERPQPRGRRAAPGRRARAGAAPRGPGRGRARGRASRSPRTPATGATAGPARASPRPGPR